MSGFSIASSIASTRLSTYVLLSSRSPRPRNFILPLLDLLDEPRQRVPIAGAVDEAGPQDHGRETVLADVMVEQNLGLGLGPRVAVEAGRDRAARVSSVP